MTLRTHRIQDVERRVQRTCSQPWTQRQREGWGLGGSPAQARAGPGREQRRPHRAILELAGEAFQEGWMPEDGNKDLYGPLVAPQHPQSTACFVN